MKILNFCKLQDKKLEICKNIWDVAGNINIIRKMYKKIEEFNNRNIIVITFLKVKFPIFQQKLKKLKKFQNR